MILSFRQVSGVLRTCARNDYALRADPKRLRRFRMNMNNASFSRRNFLGLTAVLPAALGAGVGVMGTIGAMAQDQPRKKIPIGLELYSVRGELSKDLPKTLNEVGKMGYKLVEFYSPYFKWTPPYAKEVRAQMDDLGLRCYSTHNGFESFTAGQSTAHAIELNQILGVKYIVLASAPGTKGEEGWKKLCGRLSAVVEELKPHGLSAGYHNHSAEWAKLENGQRIMEVIAANTPREFVLQLDVGTCVEAGSDPVAWVKANPGRIKCMHLKDWAPGPKDDQKGYRVLFGEGATPWKELLAAAETVGGAEYFLIEQEGSRYGEFETVKKCLENYRKITASAA